MTKSTHTPVTDNKNTIVLASGNAGKLREIQQRLQGSEPTIITQKQLGISSANETGSTFVENALLKARHAAKLSDLPALADDSGLCVKALKGAPGIYSARYSGDDATDSSNNDKLITSLTSMGISESPAYFFCAMVYLQYADDPTPIICQAAWHGVIKPHAEGHQGFGYDPLFYPHELDISAAQLPMEQKNQISHRGQALDKLIAALKNLD